MFTLRTTGRPASAEMRSVLHSLTPGMRVVIQSSSPREFIDVVTLCWDEHITLTPVDPSMPPEKLTALIGHLDPHLAIINGQVKRLGAELPTPQGIQFIVYTSGSTGAPKGVMLSRAAVELNASATARLHSFQPGIFHATCLPLHHCNALVMSVIGSYIAGSPLYVQSPFSPAEYMRAIDECKARTGSIVPALLQRIVDTRPKWPASLAYFITAAAPLSRSQAQQFASLYGPRLRQGYGMTEASNFSFLMPYLDLDQFTSEYLEDVPPVGLPVSGTDLRFNGDAVEIKSVHAMTGYWRSPEETERVFTADGWLRTGDTGVLRRGYLVLTGRSKEIINRGGETIYPREVEESWAKAGFEAPFAAAAVRSNIGEDIGLWTAGTDFQAARELYTGQYEYRPGTAQFDSLPITATGKPRRSLMSEAGFSAWSISPERYEAMLGYAAGVAEEVVQRQGSPATGAAQYIYKEAVRLTQASKGSLFVRRGAELDMRNPARQALDLLTAAWPGLCDGTVDGNSALKSSLGLWTRLMCEWPMGDYAEMMASHLKSMSVMRDNVLELGAGVGNTSRLLGGLVSRGYIRSDIKPSLCERVDLPGSIIFCDFNEPLPVDGLDLVFAVNALHCARSPLVTMGYIAAALKPGGTVIIAEGNGPTTDGATPWALNMLFGMYDGWWDRGGFIDRWKWLANFQEAGFVRCGYSQMRAGRHDLGGVIWGRKPAS